MTSPLAEALQRIRDLVDEASAVYHEPATRIHVRLRDLRELLRDYDRLDGQARLVYEPHVKDSQEKLRRAGEALEQLEIALGRMSVSNSQEEQRRRRDEILRRTRSAFIEGTR